MKKLLFLILLFVSASAYAQQGGRGQFGLFERG